MDTSTLLRIALAARGTTAGSFAQSLDPPVSESMVYAVAAGRKTSGRVQAAIDRLIEAEREAITEALSSYRMAA